MTAQFTLLPNPVFPFKEHQHLHYREETEEVFSVTADRTFLQSIWDLQVCFFCFFFFPVTSLSPQETSKLVVVVTVLYHDTDSSSKHGKINLHNLSMRLQSSGPCSGPGGSIRCCSLNGGLTQCKLGRHFPQFCPLLFSHLCQKTVFFHRGRGEFLREQWVYLLPHSPPQLPGNSVSHCALWQTRIIRNFFHVLSTTPTNPPKLLLQPFRTHTLQETAAKS